MKHPLNIHSALFPAIGTLFLCIGLFTFFNVLVGLHLARTILWGAVLFAAMDFAVAYGFFSKHRWLLYAFLLNALGQIVFVSLHWVNGGLGRNFLFSLVGISITFLIAGYLYYNRRSLTHTAAALYTGIAFFLLWTISFGYTVTRLL